ncbi:Fic family protein [Thomasclavelia saccharogumia]|uniref:Fic family protein n=1 Tax=Thomasclavelia saccharogumia TaxID=341225 RepID=UPI00047ABEC3|nr:Fic family protein [Thomasclavelia saccharogumia]
MKLQFQYTHELVNELIKIEKYKTALDYLFLPTRAKQKLMYEAKLKKTHFSTSIEGNVLSLNQVERVIQSKDNGHRLNAEQEVQNYWDALTFLEKSAKKQRQIDLEFILELHDLLEKKGAKKKRIDFRRPTPPGVLFAVYDAKTRKPEYIPPESNDIVPLMQELFNWYNENSHLPVPIIAAIMHYALVTIHPFFDGNGRTSRALATYILMINHYDFKGFNSFEEYYMSDLDGYYSSLQMGLPVLYYDGRENPPHLEIWILYFCKIMAINAENIYLQSLAVSKKNSYTILNNLSKKDLILIRYCIENNITIVKNKELSILFGVSTRAISKWMPEWVDKGILVPNSGQKRITSYRLSHEFASLKVSDLGFTDQNI